MDRARTRPITRAGPRITLLDDQHPSHAQGVVVLQVARVLVRPRTQGR